jgi:hypothetical protein
MEAAKTLIGKNGYLFLKNDSSQELKIHNENLCLVNEHNLNIYNSISHKFFMVIFPDKSMFCKEHLPDGFNMRFRPGFDIYVKKLGSRIMDGAEILKNHGDVFYKTDTHLNLKGAYIVYLNFVNNINDAFGLNLEFKRVDLIYRKVEALIALQNGLGDLTWAHNLGNQALTSTEDVIVSSHDIEPMYTTYRFCVNSPIRIYSFYESALIDETDSRIGDVLEWIVISKYILYRKNSNKPNHKVLIFYDSFLLSTLSLYLELTGEVFMAKSVFNKQLIDYIKPDFVFEFRVERFLC